MTYSKVFFDKLVSVDRCDWSTSEVNLLQKYDVGLDYRELIWDKDTNTRAHKMFNLFIKRAEWVSIFKNVHAFLFTISYVNIFLG